MSGSQREIAVDLSLENGEPGSRGKPRGAMERLKYCVRKQELQSKQSAAMAVGRRDWCQTICSQTVGPPCRTFLFFDSSLQRSLHLYGGSSGFTQATSIAVRSGCALMMCFWKPIMNVAVEVLGCE